MQCNVIFMSSKRHFVYNNQNLHAWVKAPRGRGKNDKEKLRRLRSGSVFRIIQAQFCYSQWDLIINYLKYK